jgi:aryl-alcohol dehydrogenase-like predicted oxidoreductase
MEYRRAGSSGLHISSIAYGNFLTHGEKVDVGLARECTQAALEEGITTFDTADAYAAGAAETVLGRALAGVRRDSIEVCTKVYFPVGDDNGRPNGRGLSRKHVLESIDGSLRRLGMDYIDIYQAHRFDPEVPLEEMMQAFADVVRAGKALYIGISEWPAGEIRAAGETARRLAIPLVTNQVQYSMLFRDVEHAVGPVCEEAGIGLWAWSGLAQGVLSGKYLPGQPPPTGSRAVDPGRGSQLIRRWLTDDVLGAVAELRNLAAELGLPLTQVALAWLLGRRNVAGVVVGGTRPEQVRENVRAAAVTLPEDALTRIDAILSGLGVPARS